MVIMMYYLFTCYFNFQTAGYLGLITGNINLFVWGGPWLEVVFRSSQVSLMYRQGENHWISLVKVTCPPLGLTVARVMSGTDWLRKVDLDL